MESPIALPDGPLVKRRRIVGKQAPRVAPAPRSAVTVEPRLQIERSRGDPQLATMSISGFAPGQLGLAPLASLGSGIQQAMNEALSVNKQFKVKVNMDWLVRRESDGSEMQYSMNIVPFRTDPSSTLGGGAAFRATEILRLIRQRAQDKMNFVKEHESGLVFVRILKISFVMVPVARELRTGPLAGGSYKPLPATLQAKKCCINVQSIAFGTA
jgi:hypothetical protein